MAKIKKDNYGDEFINFDVAVGDQAAVSYTNDIVVTRSLGGFKMKCLAVVKMSLLGCFLFLTAGCAGLDFNNSAPIPVISGEKAISTENVIADGAPPAEVVRKAYEKMLTLRAFRMRHELIGATGIVMTTNMELVAPDRIRSTQTPTGIETIVIGNDFYMKTPGSAWEKPALFNSDSDDLGEGQEMFKETFMKFFKDFEVKAIGSDTVDKIPVKVYECTPTSVKEKDKTKMKFWIGERDYLIHKMETELDFAMDGEKPNQVKSAYKLYDFGADIKIEPPM